MKFLLIILLIFLFFRVFGRYIFAWLLQAFVKKAQRNFQREYTNGRTTGAGTNHREGQVDVEGSPASSKNQNVSDDVGEYVDFEEVKED